MTVEDPGFPAGGAPTSDAGTFWRKTYAKMKELDPLGGGGGEPAAMFQ